MKEKLLITLGTVLAIVFATIGLTFANSALNPSSPSEYKIGISYPEAMRSDKPAVVLFYTDWCGYCKKFMPKFRILSKLYKDDYNFVMINGEAQENIALTESCAITSLPTLYIFDPKYDNRVHITNGIYTDLKRLRTELNRYIAIRKKLDAAESCVAK